MFIKTLVLTSKQITQVEIKFKIAGNSNSGYTFLKVYDPENACWVYLSEGQKISIHVANMFADILLENNASKVNVVIESRDHERKLEVDLTALGSKKWSQKGDINHYYE